MPLTKEGDLMYIFIELAKFLEQPSGSEWF